jgi:hypothetical protein
MRDTTNWLLELTEDEGNVGDVSDAARSSAVDFDDEAECAMAEALEMDGWELV